MVYDDEAGLHYMFGGNPGGKENRNGKLRLGDFWRLELIRQANTDLERLLLKDIRISRFREKSVNPKDALTFLQKDVSRCIDHRDVEEQKQFQMLAAQLFNQVPNSNNVHIMYLYLYNEFLAYSLLRIRPELRAPL